MVSQNRLKLCERKPGRKKIAHDSLQTTGKGFISLNPSPLPDRVDQFFRAQNIFLTLSGVEVLSLYRVANGTAARKLVKLTARSGDWLQSISVTTGRRQVDWR